MKQRFFIFLLFSVSLFSFTPLFAASYKDSQTGLSFPETLGSMKRMEKVEDFEKDYPGLGIGLLYQASNPGIYSNIYIYNLGIKNIPDGSDSKIVHNQWKQAEGDIFTLEKRGTYQSVKKLYGASSLLGTSKDAPTAFRADFSYSAKGMERLSHLYLLGYKNYFVKIRFTYPEKDKAQGEKELNAFLADFGKLVSK